MPGAGQGQLNPVYLHSMKTNQKDDLVLTNIEVKIGGGGENLARLTGWVVSGDDAAAVA